MRGPAPQHEHWPPGWSTGFACERSVQVITVALCSASADSTTVLMSLVVNLRATGHLPLDEFPEDLGEHRLDGGGLPVEVLGRVAEQAEDGLRLLGRQRPRLGRQRLHLLEPGELAQVHVQRLAR